jgi:hypothetical protein
MVLLLSLDPNLSTPGLIRRWIVAPDLTHQRRRLAAAALDR